MNSTKILVAMLLELRRYRHKCKLRNEFLTHSLKILRYTGDRMYKINYSVGKLWKKIERDRLEIQWKSEKEFLFLDGCNYNEHIPSKITRQSLGENYSYHKQSIKLCKKFYINWAEIWDSDSIKGQYAINACYHLTVGGIYDYILNTVQWIFS